MFHLGCHDYLYFLVTVLVINVLPLNSKFTLFACSVKRDLILLNNFPLSTGMMLSFAVEGCGKTPQEENCACWCWCGGLAGSYDTAFFASIRLQQCPAASSALQFPQSLLQAPSMKAFSGTSEDRFLASSTNVAFLPSREPWVYHVMRSALGVVAVPYICYSYSF